MTCRVRGLFWLPVLLCGLIVASSGCSRGPNLGEPVKVTGKITRKGQPLGNVTVGFITTSEGVPGPYRYASAKTTGEGTYEIEKVYPGSYTVSVVPDTPAPDASGKVEAKPGDPVLVKYGVDSPFKAEVFNGQQEFTFDIPE